MAGYTTSSETKLRQARETAQATAKQTGQTFCIVGAAYGTLGTNYHVIKEAGAEDFRKSLEGQSTHYVTWIKETVKPE